MARRKSTIFASRKRRAALRSEVFVPEKTPLDDDFTEGRHAFDDTPDPRFFYVDAATEAVRDGLLADVLGRKGLRLLVGEPGMGKTTLLLDLKRKLEAVNCLVVLSRGTKSAFDDLLDACSDRLEKAKDTGGRMERIRALAELLVERLEAGSTTAFLVDDAQALSDDALEDLSWLTDLEKGGHKLIQIVLAGQPDLVPRLCGSRLLFVQDSAIDYSGLKPLNPQDVGAYIRYRLQAAEFPEPDLFSAEAIERIARHAEGVPRQINKISAMSLRLARRRSADIISAGIADEAARELASRPQVEVLGGSASEGRIADDVLGDHVPAPAAAGTLADIRLADTRSGDDAGADSDAPIDIPAQPAPDDGNAEGAGAFSDGTAGANGAAPGRPPFYGDLRTGPTLAPFPSNLSIPPADVRPVRRRGSVAVIAVLFLVGLVLGGAGMFFYRDGGWIPDGASWTRILRSDGEDAPSMPSDTDGARRADRAPEVRPAVATAAVEGPLAERPAASTPTLEVAPASGREDQAIPLDISAAAADTATLTIAISGLPDGARLSAGLDSGDGIWSLGRQDLTGLALTPAPNFSGQLRLGVDASARWPDGRSASVSRPLTVAVAGAADRPVLDLAEASGKANEAVPLDIYAALADNDGSESLSVTISGLPEGARLTAGHDRGADGWRLGQGDLANLALVPPSQFAGRLELSVVATAREADGDSASTKALLNVDVTRAPAAVERAPTALTPAPVAEARAPAAVNHARAAVARAPTALTRAPTAEARAPAAVAHAAGDFVLQLAALRSIGDAEREVVRLKERFHSLLGDAPLKIYEAEVNGVPYYRVRTDPVPDKAEIFQICARLKESQQDCMVLQQVAKAKPAVAGTETPPTGTPAVSQPPREKTLALLEAGPPKPAATVEHQGITVRDLVLARDVVDREPTDLTTTFSPRDGRAFAHAKIYNPGAPTEVSFVWLYDDALYATVDMKVGTSVRWRTWSSAEVWLGKWRVQIVSADGQVLAENDFTVQ